MSHLVGIPTSGGSPVLTQEHQRLVQRKAQILKWIANPLHLFLHSEHKHGHGHHPLSTNEGHEEHKLPHTDTSASRENILYEEIEAEEAHPLELFYDLFFVANLTTITSVHAMTDYSSMVSYVLFFIILWFTWLQTTFYDIRFTNDSLYERVIRAIHFGVMIGFASVSTNWNPLDPSLPKAKDNVMSMSLTLMASRMALGVQYAVASVYAVRLLKKGILPLVIHTVAMFGAGIGYLALYFVFRSTAAPKTYIAWYAIIGIELATVMASSMYWKVVSFKRTHLVERLGLLTLIIIGEGIIVMLKAVNTVEKGAGYGRGWSASIFFVVACAVGILYLLYMFYFDYTPRGVHYGTIRQQFWAVLHFPFHLAIVLSVEGLRQLSTWWSFNQAYINVQNRFTAALESSTDPQQSWEAQLVEIGGFLKYLYDDGTAKDVTKNYGFLLEELDRLSKTAYDDQSIDTQIDILQVQYDLTSGFAEWYGIKVPKTKGEKLSVGEMVDAGLDVTQFDPLLQIMKVYNLVYTYFFSALAVVFFMYGVLGLFVRRKKDGWDYFSVAWRFLIGFTFIGIERIKSNELKYADFMGSFWPIPVVLIIMVFALLVDKVVGLIAYKRLKASLHYHG